MQSYIYNLYTTKMDALYLLQYTCLIFMMINAAFVALSALHTRWKNKKYERSRWMLVAGIMGLAAQYLLQMKMGLRASSDDLGAVVNMLIYMPCFTLITMSIYNIEATHSRLRHMNLISALLYATIIGTYAVGRCLSGSNHIGPWLYVMLLFYVASTVYLVCTVMQAMTKRRKLLETMSGTDMLPYVRHSRASVLILCCSALALPACILFTPALYFLAPVGLFALLFFNVTFIALGSNYSPTEELLDEAVDEDEQTDDLSLTIDSSPATSTAATTEANQIIDHNRANEIAHRLNEWCDKMGYKDSSANMMSLSRDIMVPRNELTAYFDQYQHATFRVWLSDIRFQAAKAMMLQFPNYNNDVISVECGFSSRTQLYRIFKIKEGCTPTVWRENNGTHTF